MTTPMAASPSATEADDPRERDKAAVAALLALTPHQAARWLAKWLISTDVRRGYSEHDIVLGGQGYSGALGAVSVIPGGRIAVERVGPPPSWVEAKGFPAPGYDYQEAFHLHPIYRELRAELAAASRPRQLSLWEGGAS